MITEKLQSRVQGNVARLVTYTVTLLVLLIMIGAPVVFFVWGSFWSQPPGLGGHFTLEGYERLFQDSVYSTFINTILVAILSCIIALVLGVSAIVVSIKTDIWGSNWIGYILIIQYLIPSYILALAWEFYIGRSGLVNDLLMALPFINTPPLNIYSVWGIALVTGTNYAGVVYLLTSGALSSGSAELEEAGKISGASNFGILRHISLKLIVPSLAIAAVIVFIRSASIFGVPLILGVPGDVYVVATHMYVAINNFPPDFGFATAIGMVILTTSVLGLYLQKRLTGSRQKYATIGGKGHKNQLTFNLGRKRFYVGVSVLAFLVFLYVLPLLSIILFSFQTGNAGLHVTEATWTLENYRKILFGTESAAFYDTFTNSMILGFVGAFLGMVLSSLVSYIVVKSDMRIAGFVDFMSLTPAALPSIVTGTAFLWLFLSYNSVLGLYGTLWSIMFALIAQFLVYGVRATNASFTAIDHTLEEAAEIAGAGFTSILKNIYAPLIKPGFVAGYVLLFVDMIKVLTIPLLLATRESQVLSSLLWLQGVQRDPQGGAAIAVIMIATIALVYIIVGIATDIDITRI